MWRRDPLADPEPLIRRLYAFVAYRIGDGPDAEDVTSDVVERALRYRDTYDPARGSPIGWLIGIARRALAERARAAPGAGMEAEDLPGPADVEHETLTRLTVAGALARLPEADRELLALRYGADLTARQIAELLGKRTNAVEVALHRALERLRPLLEPERAPDPGEKTTPALGRLDAGLQPHEARSA